MGLFDAIGSIIGGLSQKSSAKSASQAQIGSVDQGIDYLRDLVNSAENEILKGRDVGLNALTDARSYAVDKIFDAKREGIGALESGRDSAINALAQQMGVNRSDLDATLSQLKPYIDAGTQATQAQDDLLGLGTPEAQASAIAALQNSPLYQSLYRNSQDALLQGAAATGGLRGGNIQRALADFGSDTLSKVIQQQLTNLGGLSSQGITAAGQAGQARLGTDQLNSGLSSNIGSLDSNTAQLIAALTQTTANNAGNIVAGTGQNIASLFQGAGNTLANLMSGEGSDVAGLDVARGNAQAGGILGAAKADQNIFSGIANGLGNLAGNLNLGSLNGLKAFL